MGFTFTADSAGPRAVRSRTGGGLPDPPDLTFTAVKADPSYRPGPGDRAVVSSPSGPDLVPVLVGLAAYRVHASAATAADGRSRLQALRRAGTFTLAPGGSRVEVLRVLKASPGDTAVEVRFTGGPSAGSVGLVPAPYLIRLEGG